MNKQQLMDAIRGKNGLEQRDTVLKLGAALTVAARGAYPATNANIEHLVGFNEMQHRVYGWLRPSQVGQEYPVEQLFEGLFATATEYELDGDLGWAVRASLHTPS